MADKIVRSIIDDMEEGEVEAEARVPFSLEGKDYLIDLSTKNLTKLRAQLAPYVAHARPAGKQRKASTSTPSVKAKQTGSGLDKDQLDQVRVWARTKGMQVSDRGRVSADIRKAYEEAHAGGELFSA